jgi:hypothetical protein
MVRSGLHGDSPADAVYRIRIDLFDLIRSARRQAQFRGGYLKYPQNF